MSLHTILLISYSYLKVSPSFASKKQTILVENGKVRKDNLRKAMLTIDNLFSILRQNNVFDLQNVDYLIAEANGDFSVAKNSNELPITKSLMGVQTTSENLSGILIYEGIIDTHLLSDRKLDMNWVYKQLNKQNILDIKSIYIVVLTPNNELYIN